MENEWKLYIKKIISSRLPNSRDNTIKIESDAIDVGARITHESKESYIYTSLQNVDKNKYTQWNDISHTTTYLNNVTIQKITDKIQKPTHRWWLTQKFQWRLLFDTNNTPKPLNWVRQIHAQPHKQQRNRMRDPYRNLSYQFQSRRYHRKRLCSSCANTTQTHCVSQNISKTANRRHSLIISQQQFQHLIILYWSDCSLNSLKNSQH